MKVVGIGGCTLEVGPFTNPSVLETVDCKQFRGTVGDIILIHPKADTVIDRVLVTIRAQKAGLIEHGPAMVSSGTGVWRYVTKCGSPPNQGVIINVVAVAATGFHTGILSLKATLKHLRLECRCDGEIRRADLWLGLKPVRTGKRTKPPAGAESTGAQPDREPAPPPEPATPQASEAG